MRALISGNRVLFLICTKRLLLNSLPAWHLLQHLPTQHLLLRPGGFGREERGGTGADIKVFFSLPLRLSKCHISQPPTHPPVPSPDTAATAPSVSPCGKRRREVYKSHVFAPHASYIPRRRHSTCGIFTQAEHEFTEKRKKS